MGFKVVINACYGGFGVSELGARWLLENGADPKKVSFRRHSSGVYVACDLERHDPRLVRMVETLGADANGSSARLAVRELKQPLYRIDEYDGSERIEEPDDISWTDASAQEA